MTREVLEAARKALKKIGQSVPLNAQAVRAYDTALAAIDAALAESGETGWRDIASAPMDGTFILLCGGATDEDKDENEWHAISRPVVAKWDPCEYHHSGGWWAFAHWDSDWRSTYVTPTHWMPIPTPPSGDADERIATLTGGPDA